MDLPKNKFRTRLTAKSITYGLWNNLPSPLIGEMLAGAGFDWIVIDAEHGPFDLNAIIRQLQAMAAYEVGVVVRVPSGDPVFIKRLLDAGVQTLLVPMVNSAAEARELVAAMHYPPRGKRGVGAALGRASRWNQVAGYAEGYAAELCLLVQVETEAGYAQLDDILEVDGVDGVFFGPGDLSASMGYMGQIEPLHPKIAELLEQGLARTRRAGKIAGTIALSETGVRLFERYGANMIGVGADVLLFSQAAQGLAGRFTDDD